MDSELLSIKAARDIADCLEVINAELNLTPEQQIFVDRKITRLVINVLDDIIESNKPKQSEVEYANDVLSHWNNLGRKCDIREQKSK